MNVSKNEWAFSVAEIKALLSCVTRQASRRFICGVHLGSEAVATDGRRMLVASPTENYPGRKVTVTRDSLTALLAVKGCKFIRLTVTAKAVHGRALDKLFKVLEVIELEETGEAFPDYNAAWVSKSASFVDFDPKLLAGAVLALSRAQVDKLTWQAQDSVVMWGRGNGGSWRFVLKAKGTTFD